MFATLILWAIWQDWKHDFIDDVTICKGVGGDLFNWSLDNCNIIKIFNLIFFFAFQWHYVINPARMFVAFNFSLGEPKVPHSEML